MESEGSFTRSICLAFALRPHRLFADNLPFFSFAFAASGGILVRRPEGAVVKKFFLNGCGYHNDLVFAASGRLYQATHADFSGKPIFFPQPIPFKQFIQ
jgi:hypothetical protein